VRGYDYELQALVAHAMEIWTDPPVAVEIGQKFRGTYSHARFDARGRLLKHCFQMEDLTPAGRTQRPGCAWIAPELFEITGPL